MSEAAELHHVYDMKAFEVESQTSNRVDVCHRPKCQAYDSEWMRVAAGYLCRYAGRPSLSTIDANKHRKQQPGLRQVHIEYNRYLESTYRG